MTTVSKILLVLALSCSMIDAADSGSPARIAGAKRRTSNPDVLSVIAAAGGTSLTSACPSTPMRPDQKEVQVWTKGRGRRTTPVRTVHDPSVRDALLQGVETNQGRVAVFDAVQAAKDFSPEQRIAVFNYADAMANAYVAEPLLYQAQLDGKLLTPDLIAAAVATGNSQAMADFSGKRFVGPGKVRREIGHIRNELLGEGHPVTPGLKMPHVVKPEFEPKTQPKIVKGGHTYEGYLDPLLPIKRVEKVLDLPGSSGAAVISVESSTGVKSFKSVWDGVSATEPAIARRFFGSQIVGVDSGGKKQLLQCADGSKCIAYLNGPDTYGTMFPTGYISRDDMAKPEVHLGYRDGAAVRVPAQQLRAFVADLIARDPEFTRSITMFQKRDGTYVLNSTQIERPELYGFSVELSEDDIRAAGGKIPKTSASLLPVPVGTPMRRLFPASAAASSGFGGAASSSGAGSSSRASSPIPMRGLGSPASGGAASTSAPFGKP